VQTGESGAEEHDIGGNDLKALAAEQIKIVLAAMSLPKAQVRVNCTRARARARAMYCGCGMAKLFAWLAWRKRGTGLRECLLISALFAGRGVLNMLDPSRRERGCCCRSCAKPARVEPSSLKWRQETSYCSTAESYNDKPAAVLFLDEALHVAAGLNW
jgi:hypothetical protein